MTADRTLAMERRIKAPRAVVWGAWMNPVTLPQWWGPDGFTCRTARIDLRSGGEWLFEMIGPDGTVYPNHHKYSLIEPQSRIEYTLLAGEDGPKHADAFVTMEPVGETTQLRMWMIMESVAHYTNAKAFGAEALGLQTLGKLARFVGAD